MQAEDWGTYKQEPWMTGGAWKDSTDRPHRPTTHNTKTKQPATNPTPSDKSNQDDPGFRAEVDTAELRLKLRRWNFARSWKTRPSNPLGEEEEAESISPLCPIETSSPTRSPNANPPSSPTAPQVEKKKKLDNSALLRSDPPKTAPKPTPPLEKDVMAQYLDRCIAVTETQLAGARGRRKKGAVKEIERLVERVVREGA